MGRLPLSQFKLLGHGIRSHVLRLLSVHYPGIGLGVPYKTGSWHHVNGLLGDFTNQCQCGCITGDFADDTPGEIEAFQTLTLKLPRYETYNLIGQYHKVNATILEKA